MIDFSKSFKKGIAAAAIADKSRQEINLVFEDLNEQLNQATDGKVAIRIRKPSILMSNLKQSILNQKGSDTIIAFKPQDPQNRYTELAKWSQNNAGYPCKIVYDINAIYCEDKEALEVALAKLLEDPAIGEKLYKIMNLELNQDEEKALSQDSKPES